MAEESDATTRQQVLDLIVEKGPVTASSIAKVLGLTTAAVRRHITLLLDSKEIAEHEPSAPSKRGRGRPARHYVATERAHVHLADGYSDLARRNRVRAWLIRNGLNLLVRQKMHVVSYSFSSEREE